MNSVAQTWWKKGHETWQYSSRAIGTLRGGEKSGSISPLGCSGHLRSDPGVAEKCSKGPVASGDHLLSMPCCNRTTGSPFLPTALPTAEASRSERIPGAPPIISVHVLGTVFLDLVFTSLDTAPSLGIEVHSKNLGTSPGGVANTAVALARLGAEVSLSALFAEDAFGLYLWSRLAAEGIDLSASRRVSDWSTPVTVSVAHAKERALITHETTHPVDEVGLLPNPLKADALFLALPRKDGLSWIESLPVRPTIYADVGWQEEDGGSSSLLEDLRWVDVFLPNTAEAQRLTGTEDIITAARALATRGPLVVGKAGARGAVAVDAIAPPLAVEGVPIEAVDSTGAGDVFDGGLIYSAAVGLPLPDQLAFANLCAALSVRYPSGALAAPCWGEIMTWWQKVEDQRLRERYSFLPVTAPSPTDRGGCNRARATFKIAELDTALWPTDAVTTSASKLFA